MSKFDFSCLLWLANGISLSFLGFITWLFSYGKDFLKSYLENHQTTKSETHLINYKDKIRLYQETIGQLPTTFAAL
ncbi:MAG: hypothetical protein U0003_02480 [Vampirovibrionales bacterium]